MELQDDYEPCRARLREFTGLEDGWDGEGSVAPAADTFASVHWFLHECWTNGAKCPLTSVTSSGAIRIMWKSESKHPLLDRIMVNALFKNDKCMVIATDRKLQKFSNHEFLRYEIIPAEIKEFMDLHFKFNGAPNGTDRKS